MLSLTTMQDVKVKIESFDLDHHYSTIHHDVKQEIKDDWSQTTADDKIERFCQAIAEKSMLPLDITVYLIERRGLEREIERFLDNQSEDVVQDLANKVQHAAIEIIQENSDEPPLPWAHMTDIERQKAWEKMNFTPVQEQMEIKQEPIQVKQEAIQVKVDHTREQEVADFMKSMGIPWNVPLPPRPTAPYQLPIVQHPPKHANKSFVQIDPYVPSFIQSGKIHYTTEEVNHLFRTGRLFMIHRHDAHVAGLHWDLRIEHRGVLKSWAVPKGPHLDPRRIRLAVETNDHNKDYGRYEGVIPRNRYGAGSVQLFEMGVFEIVDKVGRDRLNNDSDVEDLELSTDWDEEQDANLDEVVDDVCSGRILLKGKVPMDPVKLKQQLKNHMLRQQYLFDQGWRQGHLSLYFHGIRLQGHYSLFRSNSAEGNSLRLNIKTWINVTQYAKDPNNYEIFSTEGSHWILVKKKDEFSRTEDCDIVDHGIGRKSALTGRTVDEIIAQEPEEKWWSWHRELQNYKWEESEARRLARSARVPTPPTSPSAKRRLLPVRPQPSLSQKGCDGGEPVANAPPLPKDDDVQLISEDAFTRIQDRYVRGRNFYAWRKKFLEGKESSAPRPRRSKPPKKVKKVDPTTSESDREREIRNNFRKKMIKKRLYLKQQLQEAILK